MIYRFMSPVSADIIMLAPHAEHFLLSIGKTLEPEGIIQHAQMPAALEVMRCALAVEKSQAAAKACERYTETQPDVQSAWSEPPQDPIGLHQRWNPLVHMLSTSVAAGKDVTWTV